MAREEQKQKVTRLLKRGLNHYGLDDLEAAIGCWEQARALDPENQAAHDYLETAYEELGHGMPKRARPMGADDDPTPVSRDDLAIPGARETAGGAPIPRSSGPPPEDPDAPDTLISGALDAYRRGDLDRAWEELQTVANVAPDRLDVQGYLQLVRTERAQRWAKEIGDQGRVLRLKISTTEVMKMTLAPEEGFLLSQIDGFLTVTDLLSLSTTDRVRTLEILARLIRDDIVE